MTNQNNHEAKTVVNGKTIPLKQAQAAEQAAAQQSAQQTGIQAHHDNSTEAVQAGQTAQNSQAAAVGQTGYEVKHVNVQSGQQHLEQHMNSNSNQAGAQQAQAQEDAASKGQAAKAKTKKAD